MGIMLRFMVHQEEVRHRGIGMFSSHLTLLELFLLMVGIWLILDALRAYFDHFIHLPFVNFFIYQFM